MAFTPIQICNIALAGLDAMPISSFEGGSVGSKLCGANFHMVLSQVLQAHPWNCATARETLAELAQPPGFGFSRQYQLPVDCLYVRKVDIDAPWRREGNHLLTDAASVAIVYTRDFGIEFGQATKAGSQIPLDPLCAHAVAYRLAYVIGRRLTGSSARAEAMFDLYKEAMGEAKSVDGMEGTPEIIDGSSWVDVE